MSALARYYQAMGCKVSGYDKTASPLTQKLEGEGMDITFSDTEDSIPTRIQESPREQVDVIYTPAIPSDHKQLNWFLESGYSVRKRAAALAEIANTGRCLAVAGTHGKTTTSSMLAYLLEAGGVGCNAFLGGIASNYDSNAILDTESSNMVVEADEFDRSFLQLTPQCAAITSIDPDHLDIYGNPEALAEAFIAFGNQVDQQLLLHEDIAEFFPQKESTQTYGQKPDSHVRAENVHIEEGFQVFDFASSDHTISDLRLAMPGRHNLHNALAASALALKAGLNPDNLRAVMPGFKGVRRRFEYVQREPFVFIDDYAHHPTEIAAAIQAARSMHPGKRITGVFQPHLFSRTKDFAEGFGKSLSGLDEVILLPIYPAREEPLPGVDSQLILNNISGVPSRLVDKSDLLVLLMEHPPEVLMTLGAGDIDRLVEPLKHGMLA